MVIAQSTLKSTYSKILKTYYFNQFTCTEVALHGEDHIHLPTYMLQVKIKCRLNLLTPITGDKIVETLCSKRVTSENKRIHTPLPPLHSKLGCLLFSIGSSNSGTTLHGGDEGRKD